MSDLPINPMPVPARHMSAEDLIAEAIDMLPTSAKDKRPSIGERIVLAQSKGHRLDMEGDCISCGWPAHKVYDQRCPA